MTRISSQKVRQAVLVTGDPLDPNTLPEKIMLFNELGEPLMLGGGFARRDVDDVSGYLNPSQIETRTLTLYPSVRLYKIKTNRPARVRMYPTAIMRDADSNRSLGVAPRGNHGRLLEVVTATDMLEFILSPAVDITSVDAFNADFYVSVTNFDYVAGPVVVTYSFFRTE
jgi:hypothetical protein